MMNNRCNFSIGYDEGLVKIQGTFYSGSQLDTFMEILRMYIPLLHTEPALQSIAWLESIDPAKIWPDADPPQEWVEAAHAAAVRLDTVIAARPKRTAI